jgi:hypothetical protein
MPTDPNFTVPLPEHACPLCGGPNDCAAARSGSFSTPCWCREATFSAELLAKVPPAMQGRACICPRCAGVTQGTHQSSEPRSN